MKFNFNLIFLKLKNDKISHIYSPRRLYTSDCRLKYYTISVPLVSSFSVELLKFFGSRSCPPNYPPHCLHRNSFFRSIQVHVWNFHLMNKMFMKINYKTNRKTLKKAEIKQIQAQLTLCRIHWHFRSFNKILVQFIRPIVYCLKFLFKWKRFYLIQALWLIFCWLNVFQVSTGQDLLQYKVLCNDKII
jgi:hypothetical protein